MSKVTVAVCDTGLASTSRTPGRRPSTCSTTAFSLAQPSPPTCRTVVATLPAGIWPLSPARASYAFSWCAMPPLLTQAGQLSLFDCIPLGGSNSGRRITGAGAGRSGLPGSRARRGRGRRGVPAWIGVEGRGAARRAEVHGVRAGAAVLGGGGRVHGHPAYRVGHRHVGQVHAEPQVETPSDRPETITAPVTDPVCGMTVDPATAAGHRGTGPDTVYFCSAGCATAFDADPGRYAEKAATAPGAATR